MSISFLKTLSVLEAEFLQSGAGSSALSPASNRVLKRLIHFVEQGCFTDSLVEHFILLNFRFSANDMTKKWNRIHFEKKKSCNTFRSQLSSVNSYLVSLFSLSADELNAVFVNEDKKVLRELEDIMDAIELGDFNVASRFPFVSQGYLPADETSSDYSVEECFAEIQLLKSLDIKVIDEMVRTVDMDKLVYVLQTIREPLVSDVYVKREGRKSKVKTALINKKKLSFCKAFHLIKSKKLKPTDGVEISESSSARGVYKEVEKIVEVPEQIPYEFSITKELFTIMEKYLEQYKLLSENEQTEIQKQSDAKSVRRCSAFLEMLTPNGFDKMVKTLNPFDLYSSIEAYKK